MWVKVTYDGNQGSVCPLCGAPIRFCLSSHYDLTEDDDDYADREIYKCESNHLILMESQLIETYNDYIVRTNLYVYHQEWKSYVESISNEFKLFLSTFSLTNEDLLWQIKGQETRLKNGLKSN